MKTTTTAMLMATCLLLAGCNSKLTTQVIEASKAIAYSLAIAIAVTVGIWHIAKHLHATKRTK